MSGFKIPSRNKKVIDEDPLETTCPYCKHKQFVTDENTEILFTQTRTYWCQGCGLQYIVGMRVYDYKYS